MKMKFAVLPIATLTMSLALAACSTTNTSEYKGVYGGSAANKPLEVPPDMTLPESESSFQLPQLASQQGQRSSIRTSLATSEFGIAKLVKEGSMRWLKVAAPADDLWAKSEQFFKDLGFAISREDRQRGVFETNFLENRVETPSGWFTGLLSKMYSSGLRDKYRIRLERADDGKTTLIFISHSGLKEVIVTGEGFDSTVTTEGWEVRPSDPELEVEMLQRLAIYLGSEKTEMQQQAKAIAKQSELASLERQDGLAVLRLNEGFARGWRRVGLGLDRLGVLVEDRNRSQGVYFIRFPESMFEEQGVFYKQFANDKSLIEGKFLLRVIEKDNQTLVAMFTRDSQPVSSELADGILKQLKKHLM